MYLQRPREKARIGLATILEELHVDVDSVRIDIVKRLCGLLKNT